MNERASATRVHHGELLRNNDLPLSTFSSSLSLSVSLSFVRVIFPCFSSSVYFVRQNIEKDRISLFPSIERSKKVLLSNNVSQLDKQDIRERLYALIQDFRNAHSRSFAPANRNDTIVNFCHRGNVLSNSSPSPSLFQDRTTTINPCTVSVEFVARNVVSRNGGRMEKEEEKENPIERLNPPRGGIIVGAIRFKGN